MTVIHPPVHTHHGVPINEVDKLTGPLSETDAVNALVDMQRANSEAIDPNGARRLVRSLVALGLLRFE